MLCVSTPVSDFRTNLRTVLTDHGRNGVTKWRNESLDDAIVSVIQLGFGPKGLGIASSAGGPVVSPSPATPDARGFLVFQAALFMLGGQQPVSIKTRAIQSRIDPIERQTTLEYLRRQIRRLETEGDPHGTGGSACFGIWAEMETAFEKLEEPDRIL
jgi:hypothetical protein